MERCDNLFPELRTWFRVRRSFDGFSGRPASVFTRLSMALGDMTLVNAAKPAYHAARGTRRRTMAGDARTLTLRIIQEIWNAKNPSLIEELYSDDCVIHTPDGEARGVGGSRRLYQTYTSSFPDLQFEIQQIVAEGDMASAQLVFSGTHKGALGEIPASGNFVKVTNNCFFRFADGKLVEQKGVWDTLSLMRQINADLRG
jgi:steroid delta-isomerase-like uncharacterized protein